MGLSYEDISRFARKHGDVKAFAEKGSVTMLQNGEADPVAFFEKDAVRFEHGGKPYSREEFEQLVARAK